jgi:tetratricopeptide (TPR) repeat protein
LLLCLAPFTAVIDTALLDNYTKRLRQQPILATLPFERWPEVLQEAANWGLLSPDSKIPRFMRLQPIFPYFLRNRLYAPEQREVRSAMEIAFREHYDQQGEMLCELLESKDPQERQVGQVITGLEYENLVTALNLALEVQVSIYNLYLAISKYLIIIQDQRRGLELGQSVLNLLETYSTENLAGPMGIELVTVIDDSATRQLNLKQSEAEVTLQKALAILLENKYSDSDAIKYNSAGIYHRLGRAAQEQRRWTRAEQYYQQAIEIYEKYNERRGLAIVYQQLGVVSQEQRRWEQAEQYCQQALQIYIEYNDRHAQAKTYGQLGLPEQERKQWSQACDYLLRALEIFITFEDDHYIVITVNYLADIWNASGDSSLPAAVATILGYSVEETEKLLQEMLEEE